MQILVIHHQDGGCGGGQHVSQLGEDHIIVVAGCGAEVGELGHHDPEQPGDMLTLASIIEVIAIAGPTARTSGLRPGTVATSGRTEPPGGIVDGGGQRALGDVDELSQPEHDVLLHRALDPERDQLGDLPVAYLAVAAQHAEQRRALGNEIADRGQHLQHGVVPAREARQSVPVDVQHDTSTLGADDPGFVDQAELRAGGGLGRWFEWIELVDQRGSPRRRRR